MVRASSHLQILHTGTEMPRGSSTWDSRGTNASNISQQRADDRLLESTVLYYIYFILGHCNSLAELQSPQQTTRPTPLPSTTTLRQCPLLYPKSRGRGPVHLDRLLQSQKGLLALTPPPHFLPPFSQRQADWLASATRKCGAYNFASGRC